MLDRHTHTVAKTGLTVFELPGDSVLALVSVLFLDLVVITHHFVELAGQSGVLYDNGELRKCTYKLKALLHFITCTHALLTAGKRGCY